MHHKQTEFLICSGSVTLSHQVFFACPLCLQLLIFTVVKVWHIKLHLVYIQHAANPQLRKQWHKRQLS